MVEQNGKVVVREGGSFRMWLGSVRKNGSKTASVLTGEISCNSVFSCNGRLLICTKVWVERSGAGQETCVVAKPSGYDSVTFDVPVVVF